MSKKIIEEIFSNLNKWRGLPAYKLEPRVDIFFSIYLKEVVKKRLGTEITAMIPEFPIRRGNVDEQQPGGRSTHNLSYKADYLLMSRDRAFLLELKTDNGSVNKKQIKYLLRSRECGLHDLICGIGEICKKTNSAGKYENLSIELEKMGVPAMTWDPKNLPKTIEIIYLVPDSVEFKKSATSIGIDPNNFLVIDFDYFRHALKDICGESDEFGKAFADYLEKWKKSPISPE